ncbi:MAG: hypothetical protein ABGF52_13705, partial [Candidatus Asgardarchaeum sp.]
TLCFSDKSAAALRPVTPAPTTIASYIFSAPMGVSNEVFNKEEEYKSYQHVKPLIFTIIHETKCKNFHVLLFQ